MSATLSNTTIHQGKRTDLKNQTQVTVEAYEEVEVSQITFSQRSQSALSITHFQEPLKLQHDFPVPEVHDHDILVNNKAIGLNPIDWKGKKYGFGIYHFPWINGRESSGVVVKTGKSVDPQQFKVGDKVIVSSTSYRDNRTSTFQQYTAIDSRLVWKLPESFSFEDGATIGVGLVTAGVIFYNSFGFELTENVVPHNGTLLIWGGATVVGIYITQLAKLHGLKVISIASLEHEAYLKQSGADIVIDRYLPREEIIRRAGEFSPEGIQYGVDTVSKETSAAVLEILDTYSSKLSSKPLFSGIVGTPKETPESVEVREVIIKRFHEDVAFGKKFVDTTTHLFNDNKIKPVRYRQYKGGLHIIDDALKDLEALGAKGEKYVVSV
ncbi:quinone oxidoreductase [Scheffersomyces xylosifermentans]|uniref:quinone oxidoreductase n=1 Tax=Scheffersomyces xylosifermentans TaxID=1304137 RepID=UPI00315DEC17